MRVNICIYSSSLNRQLCSSREQVGSTVHIQSEEFCRHWVWAGGTICEKGFGFCCCSRKWNAKNWIIVPWVPAVARFSWLNKPTYCIPVQMHQTWTLIFHSCRPWFRSTKNPYRLRVNWLPIPRGSAAQGLVQRLMNNKDFQQASNACVLCRYVAGVRAVLQLIHFGASPPHPLLSQDHRTSIQSFLKAQIYK